MYAIRSYYASARIDGRSIDFSEMVIQHGDEEPSFFSYLHADNEPVKQRPCHVARTSEEVHETLRRSYNFV